MGAIMAKMAIGEFRALVRGLNYTRSMVTGGTAEEFKRQKVPAMLADDIQAVRDAVPFIQCRRKSTGDFMFASDLNFAEYAIQQAEKTINRWHEVNGNSKEQQR